MELKKINMTIARPIYIMPMSPLICVGFLIILRVFFFKNSAYNSAFILSVVGRAG